MSGHRGSRASVYEEHGVGPHLREIAVCTWSRPSSGATRLTVLPDGCVDLVWRSDGRLFVAGPDAGPAVHRHAADAGYDGIRLRTGVAGTVLGTSAEELADEQVDLSALWGSSARVPAARLEAAASPRERRAALATIVSERLAIACPPDAPVLAAAEALARGDARVHDVAAAVGLSERQLHRRMCHQVGYGPKTLERILRFQRFLRLGRAVRAGRATLGWAAATAGYADQSHLVRECRRLAGATPSEVLRGAEVNDV
jgi:AraC-like DNA-binding protein